MKLFKRYFKSCLAIVFFVAFLCGVLYLKQQEIYWTSLSFSDATVDSNDSSLKLLSGIMGDNKGGLRASDILNLRTSVDFNRKMAQSILNSEHFNQFRLDLGIFGDKNESPSSIKAFCKNNNECVLQELVLRLPKFYQISDKDRNGVHFVVEVKALDELTANLFLKFISKAILDTRTEVLKSSIKDQEKMNLSMLIERKKEIDLASYYSDLEEANRLDSEYKEIQLKFERQSHLIVELQNSFSNAESNFQRSKSFLKRKVNIDELGVEKKRSDLKIKIEKLNGDINALEDIAESKTLKDREVIIQLKKELRESKSMYQLLGDNANQEGLDSFIKKTDEKIHSKEFEYSVIKDQLANAQKNYSELEVEKRDLFEKKIKIDQNIAILKPVVEFIKNLEIKVEQLKLLAATVGPDVRFDSYSNTPVPVKKIGLILLFAYVLMLQLIFVTVYLTFRFLFDERVYDLQDLENISPNLKFLGLGPKFK